MSELTSFVRKCGKIGRKMSDVQPLVEALWLPRPPHCPPSNLNYNQILLGSVFEFSNIYIAVMQSEKLPAAPTIFIQDPTGTKA